MCMRSSNGLESVFNARSRATHFVGSQYATRLSVSPLVISIAGYALAPTFSYGEYRRMYAYSSGFAGLPHCSHSCAVSGMLASDMVLITSTNGTAATIAVYRSGRMFATTPISRPPALPPLATIRSGAV